jgi:putative photosynthetic complex assembly protein 2
MTSYLVPPIYAAFVWWFSTGAVLLLVGLSSRFDVFRKCAAIVLAAISLYWLFVTRNDVSVNAAYFAFSCTILLWGAQEIAFLSGWITGPSREPCPHGAKGFLRFSFAMQAIIHHELLLLASGAAAVALTWNGANQVGVWTFVALWVLRQSSKINLFLGVPVTNDELMPDAVSFLKTFFIRKPVSAFFPISVTLSTAVLVIMIQRTVEVAVTPFDIAALSLVSTLFALGILEHWFMLLPLPAMTLWGWGVQSKHDSGLTTPLPVKPIAPATKSLHRTVTPLANTPSQASQTTSPPIFKVALNVVRSDPEVKQANCARQRLEDQFRQTFREQIARSDMTSSRRVTDAETITTSVGRTT